MNQSLLLHLKFLVIFLFIFIFNNLFAQSKKGFKYLEEKKYAEAKIAFTKDLSDDKKAIVARYGLNKVAIAAKDTSLSDLLSNINQALEAEEMIKKAPEKLKKKLQKDNINLSSIANQNIELQKVFIKYLGKYGDMSLVDSFLTIVPKPSRSVLTKFNVARTKIVSKSAEDATDYSSLQHLFKNHRNFVNKTNLKFSRNIENHLLELFVQEFGYEKFDVFAKDYPNFWLSKDCFVKEATDALKSKNLSAMLQFIREHPLSMMNELMCDEIIKNTYWKPTEKENLSESEQKQLESISKMVNLNAHYHYTDGKIPDSTIVSLSKNIKENAPSVNAYYLMHRAIQYYLTNKKWKEAESLVTTMQPFFPDEFIKNCNTRYTYYSEKQDWFKSASTIIKREAEGLVVEAVRPISTYYGEEFSPVLSADGKTMYFAGSGRRDNFDGEDIFYATLKNGKWTNPMIIEELSGEGNEAPLSITADDNTMLLFIDGKLNTSERTLTGWSTPEQMSKAINSLPWIGRATLSSNGRTLLMEASKEEDVIWGESNIDIYMSQKDGNGQWSVPRAIGSDINTGGQERSPFLHADDKTLYFSSNGHKGLGEIDVYKTTRLDESWTRWSEPVNLGKEINTLDDDWGYSFAVSTDGRRAYLSTRRQQGSLSDIVTLRFAKQCTTRYAGNSQWFCKRP